MMHPEKTCEVIERTIREFVRLRGVSRDSSGTKQVTIVSPDARVCEELARYLTDAVLKIQDTRRWTLTRCDQLQPGDTFTFYELSQSNGTATQTDVDVINVRPMGSSATVRVSMPDGKLHDIPGVSHDYLFLVHRPTADELKDRMRVDLAAEAR